MSDPKVVPLKLAARTMACVGCDSEIFTLHEDGTIRCEMCRTRVVNVSWAAKSNSSPKAEVSSLVE